jgi:hypothetical protein
MNPDCPRRPAVAEGHPDLEARVRAAGSYVGPSANLRPRTLEAAREVRWGVRRRRRLASVGLAAATLWWTATRQLADEAAPAAPTLAMANVWQLGEAARKQAAQGASGPGWAAADAMTQLRGRQQELLATFIAR